MGRSKQYKSPSSIRRRRIRHVRHLQNIIRKILCKTKDRKLREANLENDNFGAGSRKLQTQHSSIKTIAKVAGSTRKKAKLLMRLTAFEFPDTILELGTSLGLGTAFIEQIVTISKMENCTILRVMCTLELYN